MAIRKILYISSFALLFASSATGQNVNYEVRIAELMANADNNDGGGFAGSQEPTWLIWLMDNGTTGTSLTTWQPTGCIHTSNAYSVWWTGAPSSGPNIPFNWLTVTNTDATQLMTEMEGWENDCGDGCDYESTGPFLSACWINSDDNYDARGASGTIDFQDDPPCTWNQYTINRGDYFARIEVYWEYVTFDPGTVDGDQSVCNGGDPAAFTSPSLGTGNTSPWVTYQWQIDVGCSGTFVDIAGATNPTYDPPVGITQSTCYRRAAIYNCATDYSNTITVLVETPSTDPTSATADPTAVCGTGTVDLTANGGALGTGADWVWYDDDPNAGGVQVGTGSPLTGINVATSTTFYVRAEGNCDTSNSAFTTVTIDIPPIAPTAVTATQTTICAGSTVDLTVTGGSLGTGGQWAWYTTDPTVGSPIPVFTSGSTVYSGVSPPTTTTYYVRAEACDTTAALSVTITVNTLSQDPSSVLGSATSVCAGDPVTLTVGGGLLGTGADWYWYQGGCGAGAPIGSGTAVTINPTTTTSYFVRAEGTCNNSNCASITILVDDLSTDPTTVVATQSSVCPGDFTVLTVAGGTLGAGATWEWYSGACGGLPVGTGGTITVTPGATTDYFVRAEGTCNTTNCASITIDVEDLSTDPGSITASASNVCPGSNVTLDAVGGTLGAGASWEWYSGSCGGLYIGAGTSISVTPTATTTYYVRAEGTCNTTNCANVTVIVDPVSAAPTSISATNTTVCPGDQTTLSVVGGTLAPNDTWTWYEGGCGAGTQIGTGATLITNPTANTTYFVRAEGPCGNTTCASVSITMDQLSTDPATVTATDTAICVGFSSVLSVSGGSLGTGAGWVWYSGSCGGAPVGTGNSISVSPSATTTYYVRAEGNCNNTNCASVTINVGAGVADPTGADLTIDNICPGDTTEVFVIGAVLPANYSYVWYTGACGAVTVGVGENLEVAPTSTTKYYVRAVGTCGATACQTVTVNVLDGSVVADGIDATNNNFCEGDQTTLSVIGGQLATGADWVWYEGSCGGNQIGTGTSITVSPTNLTNYYVRAEGGTCGNTACQSIVISVLETDVYVTSFDDICGTAEIFELDNGLPVGGTYSGTGVSNGWFDPQVAGVGTHTISYSYTSNAGCTGTATADITILPTDLNATAEIQELPCAEGGVTVEVSSVGGGGYYTYFWSDGSTENPRNYMEPGTYQVTVTDAFGCRDIEDNIVITESMACIEIPNSFTPNSDGHNDFWNVNLTGFETANMKVFSKWGRLVWETNDLNISWDGTSLSGLNLPAATYYYILELDNGNRSQNGPLTILR